MAIRSYAFTTGITASSAPSPSTPTDDSDVVSKGYSDDTYAKITSWYDKQATISAIKSIASADRSDGQVVFAMSTNVFYRFDSGSSAAGDDDTVLTPSSGTGRWLKISGGTGGGGNSIVQQYDAQDSGVLAAEVISANEVVMMKTTVANPSSATKFRIWKADADSSGLRAVAGICKSTVSGTAQQQTYTISAAFVSGNSIPITINGQEMGATSYASSSDATLQTVATLIATHADVASATVTVEGGNQTGTDDRVITIVSRGFLTVNISSTTVTGGASQPTVTITETVAVSAPSVDIHDYGPLGGFSGLTVGSNYYLSSTAGAVTATPSDTAPVYIGKALTSAILLVDIRGKFTRDTTFGEVWVSGGNGHGSTNTTIRKFSTTQVSIGTDITYATSGTDGASFTINTSGLYSITYCDGHSSSANFGATKNSSALTTPVYPSSGQSMSFYLGHTSCAASTQACFKVTTRLNVGDVVRPHTDGGPSTANDDTNFRIVRIGD